MSRQYSIYTVMGALAVFAAVLGFLVYNVHERSQTAEQEAEEKQRAAEEETGQEPEKERVASSEVPEVENEELLERAVHAEAKDESFEGMVAVASVILNRIESETFPDDVESVIYEENQFQVVSNGSIEEPPSERAEEATEEALDGSEPVGDSLFFWSEEVPKDNWLWETKTVDYEIGGHVFSEDV
ncbi:cell wall hydrolase [Marinococcus luteus]|uniref:cell wall hydrolase n=1 Tax=Marinococcus luteus TaxID=1122204 RepID=UPI002ACC4841|nr:cell wall hydrolase [Marinococcus luteus]MDZ5783494.1 cell wall hydrolase [Marinococcus luteus]